MAKGEPDVHFNSVSGSDSLASGAPATMSAINGSSASLSGSTTVDLSADSPDLSGVPTDGSSVLWVDTSSGRQFARIDSVDNTAKTVTVNKSYGTTESGRNWAIGGKRKTLEGSASLLGADGWQGHWNVVLEDDQILTSELSIRFDALGQRVRSDTPGTRRKIAQTASNEWCVDVFPGTTDYAVFEDIHFTNTHATKSSGGAIRSTTSGSASGLLLLRCVIGDETDRLYSGVSTNVSLVDTLVHHTVSHGIVGGYVTAYESAILACGGDGVYCTNSRFAAFNSFFCGNGGDGISVERQHQWNPVIGCTISNNGGDGAGHSGGSGGGGLFVFVRCSITKNGGYGVDSHVGYDAILHQCNFGSGSSANALGDVQGTASERSANISAPPGYANEIANDFRLSAGSANDAAADLDLGSMVIGRDIGAAPNSDSAIAGFPLSRIVN